MNDSVIVGEIDRISGSGNAMLDVGANEYNLGPLPGSTVGNPAIAVPLSTTWAVCITPYIPRETYLSKFKSTTGKTHSEIAQAIGGAEFTNDNIISDEGLKTTFDDFVVSQPPEEPVEGDSLDVQIAISGSGASYVFFEDGDAVEVDIPFLPAGHETTIKLTDADSPIWSATLDESILEKAPSPGTELTVEILDNDGSTAYGLHESIPVFLPDCPASKGNYVHAAVTSRVSNGVEASVSSLPEDERLSAGDSFELELDLSPNDSATTLVHEGLPVQISPPIFPVNETVPVTITEVETNRVTAEVDFTEQSGSEFEVGQELSINQLERRQNKLIGKYDEVPITFSITEEPPTVPDSLDVTIQEILPEEISATIQDHSRLRSLQSGDVITVKINREQGDYLIGKYNGFPVWIPFDGKAIPSELTVAVTQIADYGIFASVADLPEDAVPDTGQIVPAKIEERYTTAATAWLETIDDIDSYAVPVLLPLNSDIQGEVGIEVVDRDDAYLIGIVRTTTVGENANPVSTYLLETQRALIALRNRSFSEAASAWETAAEETNLDLREVDAKRSAVYGKIEEALKNEQIRKANSLIDDFYEYLNQVVIPSDFQTDIQNEIEAYEQLISATQERAPDSVTDLQRIAYNVNIRSQVNQAAGQAPRSSGELKDGWIPVFPHPFLVHRVQQLSDQFDSMPDAAKEILTTFEGLEQIEWSVAPASSDEPKPAEAFDIEPLSPNLSSSSGEKEISIDNDESNHEILERLRSTSLDDKHQAAIDLCTNSVSEDVARSAIPELKDALSSGNPEVQGSAASAISDIVVNHEISVQGIENELVEIIDGDDKYSKLNAIMALSVLKVESSTDKLEQVLTKSRGDQQLWSLTRLALHMLSSDSSAAIEYRHLRMIVAHGIHILVESIQDEGIAGVPDDLMVAALLLDDSLDKQKQQMLKDVLLDAAKTQPEHLHDILPLLEEKIVERQHRSAEYAMWVLRNYAKEYPDRVVHLIDDVVAYLEPSQGYEDPGNATGFLSEVASVAPSQVGNHREKIEALKNHDEKYVREHCVRILNSLEDTEGDANTNVASTDLTNDDTDDRSATNRPSGSQSPTSSSSDGMDVESEVDSDQAPTSSTGRISVNVEKDTLVDTSTINPDIPDEVDEELIELRKRAEKAASENPERDIESTTQSRYRRASPIGEYAKRRADGICECCEEPAPFRDKNGDPYLESHHVDELGEGGADSPDKVAAICPNCHKRIHHGEDGENLNKYLRQKLEAGLADIGK